MTKPKLLIVDDDETIRSQMRWVLSKEYEVQEAGDRLSAWKIITTDHPPVALLDLGLPPRPRDADEGLQLLKEINNFDPIIKVIIITGNTDRENALRAISFGAFDFFTKPPVVEEVRIVVERAFRMVELELENLALRNKVQTEGMEGILGNSPAMEKVFQTIRKIATVDVPVLILGESGTGKELTARAVHQLSNRRDRPFVVINCGAIPETLLESELFGYEKGAFTGANTRRKGRFEYAEGGTLFLDEIGELSITLQVKILRFLQEHIIERIGGRETISLDVRVVAATNKDLKRGVDEGQFREDLYFRLSVVTVSLPSLHERGDDIFLLSQAFLRRYCGEFERDIKGFLNDAIISLSEYNWPGNVRELENRIKRAVVMAEGEMITSKDLDFVSSIPQEGLTMSLKEAKDRLEKELVQKALLSQGGIVVRAAKELGVSRQTLTDLIKKYGL